MTEWKETKSDVSFWKPETFGDELIGKVIAKKTGDYGDQYSIQKENGEVVVTPSHKVLQNRMAEIKLGDMVKIVYDSEDLPKVKGQNSTKIYKVFTK